MIIMENIHFESMSAAFAYYNNFTLEELKKEHEELTAQMANMISNPDLIPRLSMVESLIEQKEKQDG